MSRRSALGTVSQSQANSRRDSLEPRRVNKTKLTSRTSLAPQGRKSMGVTATRNSSQDSQSSGGRQSIGGRQSLGGKQASGRQSGGRQSLAGGRQSLAGGRQSIGGRQSTGGRQSIGGRRSSIHGASATAFVDPRPLTDVGFRNGCIRSLIQFLTENGYGHPISPKLLTSPSDQDFFRIFQFLYHRIDPNFTFASVSGRNRKSVSGRQDSVKATETMVEQIPVLLKNLGYPFKINRSAVISCGSHSNWPKMLGSLHFLLEIVTLQETIDINSQVFGQGAMGTGFDDQDESASQHNQLMFEYLYEAYQAFLLGDDELKAQLDDEMLSSFQNDNDKIAEMTETLVVQNEQLTQELTQLKTGPSALETLNNKKKIFSADIGKFEILIGKLGAHLTKRQTKLHDAQLELEQRVEEKQKFITEFDRLQNLFDKQDLTQADVQRMKTARSKLDEQLSSIQTRKEAMDERAWKQEVALTNKHEAIDDVVAKYNKLAEELHLIPQESQLAGGIDFEVRKNPCVSDLGHQLLDVDIQGYLVPAIHSLKDNINSKLYETQTQRLGHEEQLRKIDETIHDKQEQCDSLARKLEVMESNYKQQKVVMDESYKQNLGNIETIQQQLKQMQNAVAHEVEESTKAIQKANRELQVARDAMKGEKDGFENVVVRTLETVTKHKAQIQEFVSEYKSAIADHRKL